ncbi:PTTG1 interacting protein b [Pholidichthys leucotaenia]
MSLQPAVLLVVFCGVFQASRAQVSTPPPASVPCALRSNTSCEECLQNVTCLWCVPTKECLDYPVKNILPPINVCSLDRLRWSLCWVNLQTVIIIVSVLASIIIICVLACCCWCCKCRRLGKKREDAREERQTQMRKTRQKARRAEMQLRHDEIRHKYGLAKDNPYARIDDH